MSKQPRFPEEFDSNIREVRRFNIMVAGESGLGKTTFLRSILQNIWSEEINLDPKIKIKSASWLFGTTKTVEICELGTFLKESKHGSIKFTLFDTPGYGDHLNNQDACDILTRDLQARHLKWSATMRTSSGEVDYLLDNRIHLCLYFISSHRMKEIDAVFIKQLAELVCIIPVVAKSDTMTISERTHYLRDIKLTLREIDEQFEKRGEMEKAVDGKSSFKKCIVMLEKEWTDEEFRTESQIAGKHKTRRSDVVDMVQPLNNAHDITSGSNLASQRIIASSDPHSDAITEEVASIIDEVSHGSFLGVGTFLSTQDHRYSASTSPKLPLSGLDKRCAYDSNDDFLGNSTYSQQHTQPSIKDNYISNSNPTHDPIPKISYPTITTSTNDGLYLDENRDDANVIIYGSKPTPTVAKYPAADIFNEEIQKSAISQQSEITLSFLGEDDCLGQSTMTGALPPVDILYIEHVDDEDSMDDLYLDELRVFPNVYAIVADPKGVRVYPWGRLDVNSRVHSDFTRLRENIFKRDNLTPLTRMTNRKTTNFIEKGVAAALLVNNPFSILDNTLSVTNSTSFLALTLFAAVLVLLSEATCKAHIIFGIAYWIILSLVESLGRDLVKTLRQRSKVQNWPTSSVISRIIRLSIVGIKIGLATYFTIAVDHLELLTALRDSLEL